MASLESHRSTARSSEDASPCRRADERRGFVICAPNPARGAVDLDDVVVGITVHGRATIIGANDSSVGEIEPVWREIYGSSPFEWGEGVVFMRIEPTSMWAYAFHPDRFPGELGSGEGPYIALATMRKTTTTIAETPTSMKNVRNAPVTLPPSFR